MARGMLRGAAAAWLGLIALQAFTTKAGAGAVGGLASTVDGLVKRAFDPTVPAIPDHSTDQKTPTVGPDGKTPDGGSFDGNGQYVPPGPESAPGYTGGLPPLHNDAYIPWPTAPGTTTA